MTGARGNELPSQPDELAERIHWRWVLALFLVALGLRLGYLFELSGSPLQAVAFGDDSFFWSWGTAIATGDRAAPDGSTVYYHAPLYPHFVALVQWCFGSSLTALHMVQAVLGALSCVFLAKAGERFISPRVGLAAGLILACYAPAIFFGALAKKVGVGLFLLTALLWLVAVGTRRTLVATFVAGLVLGLLSISRENARVLIPVLLLAPPVSSLGRRLRPAHAVALLVGSALVLGAVGLRNLRVGGEFVLGTTNLGTNAFIGNHAEASGLCEPLLPGRGDPRTDYEDASSLAEAAVGRALRPTEISDYWLGRALDDVRADPLRWCGLLFTKLYYLGHAHEWVDHHGIGAYEEHSVLLRVLHVPMRYGVLAPLGLVGFVLLIRRRRLAVVHASFVALALSIVLFFVFARFRITLVPFLALYAAAGAVEVVGRARSGGWRSIALPMGAVAVLLVAVHLPTAAAAAEWPNSTTYNALALELGRQGRTDEARAWFRKAIEVDPANPAPRFNLGEQLVLGDEIERASRELREAVRLDATLTMPSELLLYGAMARTGRVDEALAGLERLRDEHPTNAEVYHSLGRAQRVAGDLVGAIASYEESLRLGPARGNVESDLAFARRLSGDVAGAVAGYRRAIAADGDLPQPRLNLAWILATERSFENASEAMELAGSVVETSPDDDYARMVLAAARAAAGRFADAARDVEALQRSLRERGMVEQADGLERQLERYRSGRSLLE